MQETADTFGGIDIVIAGQAGNFYAPALGMTASAFKSVIDIDLLGTFNLYRAQLRAPAHAGRIVDRHHGTGGGQAAAVPEPCLQPARLRSTC